MILHSTYLENTAQVDYPIVESRALEAPTMPQDTEVQLEATSTLLVKYFGPRWQIFESIANCESFGGNQYLNGKVVRSLDGHDYGYLQIRDVHDPEMEKLGLKPRVFLEDNIHAASIIFQRQGYSGWENCSRRLSLLP